MEQFEMAIWVKPPKRLEFKQTLDDLNVKLQKHCTNLEISESDDFLSFSIIAKWENEVHMQEALRIEEFEILSGAVTALCDKIEIHLNDKLIGNHISKLKSL